MGHDHSQGKASCPACKAASKPVKVVVPLRGMIEFRPADSWKGEYGFDWMRIGGVGSLSKENAYKGEVDRGVKASHYDASNGGWVADGEYTKNPVAPDNFNEDYQALRNEYETITINIKADPDNLKEYFVPYLNIYPKDLAGKISASYEAELKLLIEMEDDVEKIEIVPDNPSLFTITINGAVGNLLSDIAKGAKRVSSDKIKIACLKGYSKDQYIKILAYPKGSQAKEDASVIGMLKVLANGPDQVYVTSFVLVNVKTDVSGTESTGAFNYGPKQYGEKYNLSKALHQALVHGRLEIGPDLDLTEDAQFKEGGQFIKKTSDGVLDQDKRASTTEGGTMSFFQYIKLVYQEQERKRGNTKYETGWFFVFCFGEDAYDGAQGQMENPYEHKSVGAHNVALFLTRNSTTLAHEALHGFGLGHTHREMVDGKFVKVTHPNCKHVFSWDTTENVMKNMGGGFATWRWQWEIMTRGSYVFNY